MFDAEFWMPPKGAGNLLPHGGTAPWLQGLRWLLLFCSNGAVSPFFVHICPRPPRGDLLSHTAT